MDSCICPFSIRHPLLVSAAIILVCGLLTWRVLLCEESRRRGGGANREGDRGREQLLEAAAGDDLIPHEYLCPITLELMKDPVSAMDGHTYERSAISKWLKTKGTSPKTNEPLLSKELVPNHALKSIIRDWGERQSNHIHTV